MAETIAGAIRETLIDKISGIQVYRNTSPAGAQLPLVVVTDAISITTEDLGDEIVINEEVQVDLYQDYSAITTLPDEIHSALDKADLSIPSSYIHRCRVISRTTNIADEGNDDGVERITLTLEIKRMLASF